MGVPGDTLDPFRSPNNKIIVTQSSSPHPKLALLPLFFIDLFESPQRLKPEMQHAPTVLSRYNRQYLHVLISLD